MGKEYGTTTGKKRKVNWLNVDKLIDAIRISGAMQIIVSKTDVLEQVGKFKMYYLSELRSYSSLDKMKSHLEVILTSSCERVEKVFFSGNIETVDGLLDSDLIIPH
jgi:adenylosuccinate synthase